MINGNEWVITTFGAGSPESEDRKNVDEFLQKNKFIRCENQSEWKENLEGRAYLVAAGNAGDLGYYFNLNALKELKKLFLKYDEWRIATNEDFNAMFEHAASFLNSWMHSVSIACRQSQFQRVKGNQLME